MEMLNSPPGNLMPMERCLTLPSVSEATAPDEAGEELLGLPYGNLIGICTNSATATSDPALNFCKTPIRLPEELNSFCCRLWHLLPFKQRGWHSVNIGEWGGKQLPGLEAGLELRGKVHLPRTQPVSPRGHPAFDRRKVLVGFKLLAD